MCLTPPNTLLKVQKHIIECQHEVKTNIFNQAFSLISEHVYHHPNDHVSINVHDHDDYLHPNFTLTEKEVLQFFEKHDHSKHGATSQAGHLSHGATSQLSLGSGPLASLVDVSHEVEPIVSYEQHEQSSFEPDVYHSYPNPHPHAWQHSIEDIYDKTDAVQLNNKPQEAQHSTGRLFAKQNPYAYFNPKTGEAVRTGDRLRRSIHDLKYDSDHSDHSDSHYDWYSDEIHPTTVTFKDKRIAGVSSILFPSSTYTH